MGGGVGRHRHTPASLSLPFLFPLRSAKSSTREGTRPPAPGRALPPTPRLPIQDTASTSGPFPLGEGWFTHTRTCTHAHVHTSHYMHTLGMTQLGLGGSLFADPQPPGGTRRMEAQRKSSPAPWSPPVQEEEAPSFERRGCLQSRAHCFGGFFFFLGIFFFFPFSKSLQK